MTTGTRISRKRLTLDETWAYHHDIVVANELKFRCTSEHMAAAVKAGTQYESAEIATWLFNYRALRRLEEQFGHMLHSHTSST